MDILTKICVVVLVLLVVVAMAVFATQATTAPNWKYRYQQANQRARQTEVALQNKNVAYNRLVNELEQARDRSQTRVNELRNQLDAEKRAHEATKIETANLKARIDSLSAELAKLAAGQEQFLARTRKLESDLATARKRADEEAKQVLDLSSRLRLSQTEYKRIEKLAEFLKEQVEQLKTDNEDLRESLAARGAADTDTDVATVGSDKIIVGKITAWDGDLASINVGSAKGVERGMQLVISRDGKLIGFLQVQAVELGQAAGVVVDKQADPAVGDRVETEASLTRK